jgi:hypothetical protein
LPGLLQTIKLNEKLGLDAREAVQAIIPKVGSQIQKGDLVAETKGLFGWFKNSAYSDYTGIYESVSEITGHMFIREAPTTVEIKAYIEGTVAEIIEEEGVVINTEGAMIQGIFGVGGEKHGELRVAVSAPTQTLDVSHIQKSDSGKILIGGAGITQEALTRASEVGVAGIVIGSIHDEELVRYVGYEIGVAITGQEKIPFSLMITEGFGDLPMATRTFELFQSLEGQQASMHGATQIRAGVIRPEVIVVTPTPKDGQKPTLFERELNIGSPIRIIRKPYFGELGHVLELPHELVTLESEARVRVLKARLQSGKVVTVPRANVEILES